MAAERFFGNRHKTIVCCGLVIAACLVVCAGTTAASVSDLPIGYLKITDRPDGKIAVDARCVASKTLIEELCRRAGKKVEFETSCLTYTSIEAGGRWATAEKWLYFVEPIGLICKVEGDVCRVKAGDPMSRYDVSLTEDQVRDAVDAAYPTQKPVSPATGVRGSILVIDGQYVPPPFEVKIVSNPDKTRALTVNGLVYDREPAEHTPQPTSDICKLPPSGQLKNMDNLRAYVLFTLYPKLVREGRSVKENLQTVADFLNQQEMVEAAFLTEDADKYKGKYTLLGGGPLIVVPKGTNEALPVFSMDYDYDTGTMPPGLRARPISRAEAEQTAIKGLETRLATAGIHIRLSSARKSTFRQQMPADFSNA